MTSARYVPASPVMVPRKIATPPGGSKLRPGLVGDPERHDRAEAERDGRSSPRSTHGRGAGEGGEVRPRRFALIEGSGLRVATVTVVALFASHKE